MNKQQKPGGGRGIEWTDYTWNAIGGCQHACRWTMPDGSTAICYAEEVAKKFKTAYREGFEHHYWRPEKLDDPLKVKQPSRIFLDSMADLFGRWVPAEQIEQVLETVRWGHWHTFQGLTKNAPRLLQFDLPQNLWAGVSSPPDQMLGHHLTRAQQQKMLHRSLDTLAELAPTNVTWMSFEPLSWDVAPIVADHPGALRWAVIGAASNGPKVYQVDSGIVQSLLDVLDAQGVPVFFKGNLAGNAAARPWRESFPAFAAQQQGLGI
jgi:protein gp37